MSVVTGFLLGNGQNATTDTLTGTIPATAQAGDVVIVAAQSTESTPTFTIPSGWTVFRGPVDVTGVSTAYLYGRAVVAGTSSTPGAPGSSFSIVSSETRRMNGAGVLLRGSVLTGIYAEYLVDSVSTSTATIPTVTGVPAGSDVVAFTLLRRGATTPTDITAWPADWTLQAESKTAYGSIPNLTTGAFHRATAADGTNGGGTVDTDTANVGVSFIIALPPAEQHSGSLAVAGAGSLSLGGVPRQAGVLARTGSGALAFATNIGAGSLSQTGSGSLSLGGSPRVARTLAVTGSGTAVLGGKSGFTRSLNVAGSGVLYIVAVNRYQWWDGAVWRRITPVVWDGAGWVELDVTLTEPD